MNEINKIINEELPPQASQESAVANTNCDRQGQNLQYMPAPMLVKEIGSLTAEGL